ncbi:MULTISPECIES: EAL domain-containing protein [Bacillaceae]|uniref:EAL domain-containing protein n=1 Tax=Evansella alkalicola TaxID=745819 RepID=A0ABS6JXP0_9BACI|nr:MULTISPECIES: EAL domain-containing protein [Bacillaceae]MBU9721875.1 EAL domain-containing protein [Bacillus alkalicola]
MEKNTVIRNEIKDDFNLPKWFSDIWQNNNNIQSEELKIIQTLKATLEETSLIVLTNNEGRIAYVSESFCSMMKYEKEELLGVYYSSLYEEPTIHNKGLLEQAVFSGELTSKDVVFRTKSGNPLIFRARVQPMIKNNDTGKLEVVLILHQDITRLKQAERVIKEISAIDYLTGLPNRDKFERDITFRIDEQGDFILFFIDLDRFKFYNDTLGHFTGDKLIQVIAQSLINLNYHFQVYRYGGDEFTIILDSPDTKQNAEMIAEEILELFHSPFIVKGNELYITASIGISYYPEYGTTYHEIVQQSEMAMHYAKEKGKNNVQWYHSSIRTKHDQKLLLEKRLRIATERKDFQLHYQPQIDLGKKEVVGVEALIRWNDKQLGVISPGTFIPLAEETGLIVAIGDWVLEEAMIQAKRWSDEGNPLRISINISPIQFQRPDFVKKVESNIFKTELTPELLDLEITENDLMYNRDECLRTLHLLKDLGIRISIDDFGTGYSSLSYLRKFPIDTLKIDQSFIKELVDNTNDQAIVTSIIQLAHNMNLRVIAEGVETVDMVSFLKDRKCDEMQGFLYSKPLPPKQLSEFIKSTNPQNVLCV